MSGRSFTIERFEDIGSTNTYLLEKARSGVPGGLVAVTDHQSVGRGRLDRKWEAPPGSSLLVSVLLREVISAESAHFVTAAVALSGAAAAERLCGIRPGLKWPNDLVINGAKVAGILAEADAGAPGGAPGTTAVVVGMGMNLSWPGPEEAGGTCLNDASGVSVNRDELLTAYLEELGQRLDLLVSDQGRRTLGRQIEDALVTLGQTVSVTTASGTFRGVAVGLSPAGHLLVDEDGVTHEIITGDVVQIRNA